MRTAFRLICISVVSATILLSFQNCAQNNFEAVPGDGVMSSASLSVEEPSSGGNGSGAPVVALPGNNGASSGGSLPGGSSAIPGTGQNSGTTTPTPTPSTENPAETTCQLVTNTGAKRTKILFVVDVSGSNVQNSPGKPASDPDKSFRYNAMKKFLDKFRSRTNFQWQLVTFGKNSASSYLKSSTNGRPNFTANPTEMDKALAAFLKISENNNGTPYLKAFDEITANVNNDPDRTKNPDPSNYIVVFISDGLPTDLNSTRFTGTAWETNAVKLLSLSPGRLTLTTVYYGERSPSAAENMAAMAHRLGGQFVDANVAGYDFNLEDSMNMPSMACSSM